MSAGSPILSKESLATRLRPFRSRAIGLGASRYLLLAIGAIVIAIVAAMWLDTIWELPASVRWFVTRPVLFFAAAATLLVIIWRSIHITDERIASQIDDAQRTGGEILAGWQLATRPTHPTGLLSQSLAAIAASRASDRVAAIRPAQVIGTESVKQAAYFSLGLVVLLGIVWTIIPTIVSHQFMRFLYPSSDIPPYTGIFIDLELERESVLYGQDLNVAAHVTRNVERVTLVVRNDAGEESTIPMLSQGDAAWQAILTRITEPLDLYARSGTTRSKVLRLNVQMTPQLLPPTVTITPPAYTRRGAYRGKLPEQGLVGLTGTNVAWEVGSNRPLAEGRLQLSYEDGSSQQLALAPQETSDGELKLVAGVMQLTKSGRFKLTVVDIDGIESHESIEGAMTILTDSRPIVRITQPQPVSLATPDVNLPVSVVAEDDYGITSLSLFRSLNGSPSSRIAAEVDGGARQQAGWILPLPKFGLVPGDEIQLFARTEDNDPAGIKGAESPVTVIKIISVEEFQRMMVQRRGAESMQAKYQQARRYFDQLANALKEVEEAAEKLAANPDSEEAAQALQQKLAAAEQQAKEAAEAIKELSEKPLPIDVDKELSKRLAEMSKQASDMAEQLANMQPSDKNQAPPSDQQLSEQEMAELRQMISEAGEVQEKLTDQAIDPMQQMQKIMPLVVAQQRFVQITQQQRDLANRLKSLKDDEATMDDPQTQRRVAELEAEQEQLRQQLDQLLDDIEKSANELPDEPDLEQLRDTALEFVEGVRSSQADAEMTSSQQNLLGNEFSDAQANAATAADILESFLTKSDGMGNSACENCKAAFKPGAGGPQLGDSIQQMLAMMGMKPGMSGMTPGGNPGMGMGWGAGGGFAQRFPGQQNVGMYGTMPQQASQPRSGRGESSSGGVASNHLTDTPGQGPASAETTVSGNASGQSLNNIPSQYRSQVAEYFRTLTEELGSQESE